MEILITKKSDDYELLDSGNGEKLERFGDIILSRPDPQALWEKSLPIFAWNKADAHFTNSWKGRKNIPKDWKMTLGDSTFILKLSSFKHVGVFPEQSENWLFIQEKIRSAGRPVSVLNLFGYTGGATLAALSLGAHVCHVDGSKTAIAWAKENANASHLGDKKVRWMLDDALAFVKREKRRKASYDAVIFDPPAFGRGPKGEVWKIEEKFQELVSAVADILSSDPLFVLANGYATGYSSIGYKNSLEILAKRFGGKVVCGELAIEESSAGRLLPAGIFARWEK